MLKTISKIMLYLFLTLITIGTVTYVNVWIIHWAVNLFTPISMWQAFGISVLISLIGSAFRPRSK